jgi:hypothetical protein
LGQALASFFLSILVISSIEVGFLRPAISGAEVRASIYGEFEGLKSRFWRDDLED